MKLCVLLWAVPGREQQLDRVRRPGAAAASPGTTRRWCSGSVRRIRPTGRSRCTSSSSRRRTRSSSTWPIPARASWSALRDGAIERTRGAPGRRRRANHVNRKAFAFEALLELEPGTDTRAPGGAVTVALCGAWEHDGPCRWPHHSDIDAGSVPGPAAHGRGQPTTETEAEVSRADRGRAARRSADGRIRELHATVTSRPSERALARTDCMNPRTPRRS